MNADKQTHDDRFFCSQLCNAEMSFFRSFVASFTSLISDAITRAQTASASAARLQLGSALTVTDRGRTSV